MSPASPRSCAVLERTADFHPAGRCWFSVQDGKCPRHGDVRDVQEKFVKTGKLTDELDLKISQRFQLGIS